MAEDADRHILGDPITRMAQSPRSQPPSVTDDRRAGELSDTMLRREVANLELIAAEAPLRGMAPDTLRQVEQRLGELRAELARRGQAPIADQSDADQSATGDQDAGGERSWRRGPLR
jgi:hypothetical protein